mmetsp:Transcript_82804/g.182025  ORF Transcript_82804/g.182025 Transcript_82804/m.182025 type:complete len:215 (-) Transcript_82804:18-662(-)
MKLSAQQNLPKQHIEPGAQQRPMSLSQQMEPFEQQLVPQQVASEPQQRLPPLQHVPWQPAGHLWDGCSGFFGGEPSSACGSPPYFGCAPRRQSRKVKSGPARSPKGPTRASSTASSGLEPALAFWRGLERANPAHARAAPTVMSTANLAFNLEKDLKEEGLCPSKLASSLRASISSRWVESRSPSTVTSVIAAAAMRSIERKSWRYVLTVIDVY